MSTGASNEGIGSNPKGRLAIQEADGPCGGGLWGIDALYRYAIIHELSSFSLSRASKEARKKPVITCLFSHSSQIFTVRAIRIR
jgi:hypothetical protein